MLSKLVFRNLLFMLNNFAMVYSDAQKEPTGSTDERECEGSNCRWEKVFARDNSPAWMRTSYCPGHKETTEQEFELVQAPSNKEGHLVTVVLSQGDYSQGYSSQEVLLDGECSGQVPEQGYVLVQAHSNNEGHLANVHIWSSVKGITVRVIAA